MKRHQAFKFELRPNGQQANQMRQFAGIRRYVYNKAYDLQIDCYACTGKQFNYPELCRILTQWRHDPETPWLADAPIHTQQQALKDLGKAYTNFFKGISEFPTRKKKSKSNESFRFPDPVQFKIDAKNSRIFLPKIGWIKYRKSREILGQPKSITVTITPDGKFFASIQTEREVPRPLAPTGPIIAGDQGIVKFLQLNDGRKYDPVNAYKKSLKALKKDQKRLSRKTRGSKNYAKAKRRVAKRHRKIANQRKDFLHKLSTDLCKNHAKIIIEDLKISNMSRSAKGTLENPGKNVSQKAGLNRAILDQGWGEFRRQLEYKTAWYGSELIIVPAPQTSQKCPECHHVAKENRKTQAKFACVACGHTANADFVASRNINAKGMDVISARGHRVSACSTNSPGRASEQEPAVQQCTGT